MTTLVAVLPGSSYGLWTCAPEGAAWRVTCLCCAADLLFMPITGAVLTPTIAHEAACPMPALANAGTRQRQRKAVRACLAAAAARRAPQPAGVQ